MALTREEVERRVGRTWEAQDLLKTDAELREKLAESARIMVKQAAELCAGTCGSRHPRAISRSKHVPQCPAKKVAALLEEKAAPPVCQCYRTHGYWCPQSPHYYPPKEG